jgi:hypothetical protein
MQRQTTAPMPTQFRGLYAMSAVRGEASNQRSTSSSAVKEPVRRKKKSS